MSLSLFLAVLVALTACASGEGIRARFLRALVLFGLALAAITEALGALHRIQRGPLVLCWITILAIALIAARYRGLPRLPSLSSNPVVWISLAGTVLILALTAITAAFSPPNSADAMAYHMPRVVYWAQQSSVRFFPTPYLNQIMLQPLAEYMTLHTFVLSGGDRLVNFVQWFASLGSIVGVSTVAGLFGAGKQGQALAGLFCASIPLGILASSGAKNDYWLAMWLIAAIYFALEFAQHLRLMDALFLGGAVGLALLTKATAYLFIPWPLAAIFVFRVRKDRRRLMTGGVVALFLALAINAPQFMRNAGLSGSVLGFDSAHGDGFFRWRNETFGWKQTLSNGLRHLSEQLGARSPAWNQRVYDFVVEAHSALGVDANDPATTWRWAVFAPPKNANHEADSPNRRHLAILVLIFCVLLIQALLGQDTDRLAYAIALVVAFVVFCAYLKWQPFMGRLLLPLFVLASPLIAVIGDKRWYIQLALCVVLLDTARLPALENWVRPLRGPRSVLRTPRDIQYFADMSQWNNQDSYRKTVDLVASTNCATVGIDAADFQLEYPLQALLREHQRGTQFLHTGVRNASSKYPQPAGPPCAVVCLNCADDSARMQLYGEFSRRVTVESFVVFLRN